MNHRETTRDILSINIDTVQTVGRYIAGFAQFGADVLNTLTGRETYERLQYRVNHDSQTHTYSRDGMALSVTNLTERTENHKYMGVFVDMIGLRDVNNSFSHTMGDHTLRVTAWTIKRLFRLPEKLAASRYDKSLVARWGGDEFVALMPMNQSFDDALANSLVYTTRDDDDEFMQNVTELNCVGLLERKEELGVPVLVEDSLRTMLEAGISSISYRYDVGPVTSDGESSKGTLRNIEQFMAEHGSKYIRKID